MSGPMPASGMAKEPRPGLIDRTGILDYLPAESDIRHNAQQSLLDGMAFSVAPGFSDPFRGVFAIALGASNYMLALLAALPSVTNVLGQILGAWLTNRAPRRLRVVVVSALCSRSFFLLFAAVPFLPLPAVDRAWIFVLGVALANLPGSIANLAWTALMQKLFPPEYRGKVFGQRNAILGAVTITATAVGGILLSAIRFPYNYSLLNVVAFVFLMGSLAYLTTLREPAALPAPANIGPRPAGGPRASWDGVKRMMANRPFARFVVAMLALQFALNLPGGLFPVLIVREMRISTTWIGLMSTASGLSSVMTYQYWGRFSDRYGHRRTLAVTSLIWPVGSFLYCFIHAPYLPAIIELGFGLFASGFNLSLFNYMLEVSPPEESPSYIAFYNIVTSLVILAAPIVGVWIGSMTTTRVGIGIASLARLAGVGCLWAFVGVGFGRRSSRRAAAAAR